MDLKERITTDPEILLGKPVIRGTRITVETILRKLAEGATFDELLEAYPSLSREDILAALAYSAEVLAGEELIVS
ncbi:DUF433 domain-containing protein [Atrimonas thermophila]|uniref:DUF433 domain-containing protein n=1 Tax=Atrimonas thermophila TaxID=3064161 RepID=UPI00399CD5D2